MELQMSVSRIAPRAAALLSSLVLGLSGTASAQTERGIAHQISLRSEAVNYKASWAETVLKDGAGVPQATISTTTYLRSGVRDAASRPVMFAFNGGPGASSFPLHSGLLGPKSLGKPGADGKRTLSDNPDTLLDVVDLVLIDPVGTGFSRELKPGGNNLFWNAAWDASATETVIREWLQKHNRNTSPVYVLGESYGGYRVGVMARNLVDLNIAGLVMISPALDLSAISGLGPDTPGRLNDQSYVFDLPSMVVTAWHHKKIGRQERTVDQVYEEAKTFALNEYAAALQQGSDLTSTQRDRVAQKMSELTGLSAKAIVDWNLRVPMQDFRELLLPGQVVGRVDSRVSGPKPAAALVAGRSKAADDPALGLGKANVIKSPVLGAYLKDAAAYTGSGDYVSLSLEVTMAWDWRGRSAKFEDNIGSQSTTSLNAFMKAKPQARLLVIGAYYDLATTLLSQQYAITHTGLPKDRVRFESYAGGHTLYEDNRADTAAVLRKFIATPP
jgi:carboxypeptidase C (cathepsin A)